MTTPAVPGKADTATDPPKRFRVVWIVLVLSLIALAATVYSTLLSPTPEQSAEASDVWTGDGWESTKIPVADVPLVSLEIDSYRSRLDNDPKYGVEDFYTDMFHANTLHAYEDLEDFATDGFLTPKSFYAIGERIAADAGRWVYSCESLDAFLHLAYTDGSTTSDDPQDVRRFRGRFWVDMTLQALAIHGNDDLNEIMAGCGLNDPQ